MSFLYCFVLNVSSALWVQLLWEVKVRVSPVCSVGTGKSRLHCSNVRVQSELMAQVNALASALHYCSGISLHSFLKPVPAVLHLHSQG